MSSKNSYIIFSLLSIFLARLDCTLATHSFKNNDGNPQHGWNHKPSHTHTTPLRSSDVRGGPCQSPLPPNAANLNLTWLAEPKTYYLPMASRYSFALYAEILLGRSAKSISELSNMCLVNPTLADGTSYLYGYGSFFRQRCGLDPTDVLSLQCLQEGGSFGVDYSALEVETDRVVLTNNKDFLLVVRCINHQYKDYQLWTTTPFIPKGIREAVCQKINELGFNLLWALKLPCSLNSYGLHSRTDELTDEKFLHRDSLSSFNNPLNYCGDYIHNQAR